MLRRLAASNCLDIMQKGVECLCGTNLIAILQRSVQVLLLVHNLRGRLLRLSLGWRRFEHRSEAFLD